ncbi:MAG: flagellar hook-length control protein FliK [Candidatus Aquicultor sp.]|nr:flagellar hook-length control protein FliK [Candidatus Aquicultor sp.]
MNIAQLLISGSIQSQSSTQAQGTDLKEATLDFEGLLAGMISENMNATSSIPAEAEAGVLGNTPTCLLSDQKMSEEQLLAMLQEVGDALTALCDKLEEIMTSLLGGQKIEPQIEGLKGAITDSISKLSESPEKMQGNHLVLKALLNLKDVVNGEGAQSVLEESVETLPEPLRLKLKLNLHLKDAAKTGSAQGSEADTLRFKLIAHVINADQAQVDKAGVSNSHANMVTTLRGLGNINAKMMHAAPAAIKNDAARPLVESQMPIVSSALDGMVNDNEGLVADGLKSMIANKPTVSSNASENAQNPVRAQQSGVNDAITAVIDNDTLVPPETISVKEGRRVEDTSTTKAQIEDTALVEVAGSEVEEGRSETGASHDSPSETNLQVNGSVAERNSSVSKGSFAQHMANNAESAKAGAADPHGVMRQVSDSFVEKFDFLLSAGRGEAKIQLHPKHLGELRIHLLVENGSMKAVLDASSHQVKELLEANLQSLKQSLESQGIQVSRFDVSVGQQQGRGGQGSYRNRADTPAENGFANVEGEVPNIKAGSNIEGNMILNLLA